MNAINYITSNQIEMHGIDEVESITLSLSMNLSNHTRLNSKNNTRQYNTHNTAQYIHSPTNW